MRIDEYLPPGGKRKASLELHVLWRNLIIVGVVSAAFLLMALLGYIDHLNLFWPFALLILGVMVLPVLLFCVIRTVQIFRKPEGYIFCRGTLCNLHGGALRNTIYYTVVLEDPDTGGKFFVDTHAIFYTHGIMGPTIEEYTNRTVTIAYNRETEMVVVIG